MNNNNMQSFRFVYISLLGILVTACTDELTTSEYDKGEGRLVLSGMNVETVVGDVITRASLDESVLPQASDFTIDIVDTQGETVKTLQPGTLQCKLSAGTYILKATYGDAETMSAIPAFYGEQGVTITEGEVSNVTIDTRLNQTVIHPNVTADLAVHFEEYKLTISKLDGESVEMENDKDFFIPSNGSYTLTFSGNNKIGEDFSYSWQYDDLAIRTRYIVECNPDLPAFTLPEQPEGNVWSKFIYITPMTADNMTAHKEDMAQKVIDNVVYEASSDGTSWIQSEKTKEGKIVIKGLEPSTTYTLRSRFGAVNSSNTQQVTTESAQQLENGDMESWSETELFGGAGAAWCTSISCHYCSGWSSRNERTTLGAESANGTNNYGLYWRWCSGTVPTNDKSIGETAAEISTLAFYNDSFSGFVGSLFDNKREYIYTKRVRPSGTAYVGYLFTGSFDKETDSYSLGINHNSRPLSISFDYKYSPVASDQCIAYAEIYDENMDKIASTLVFNSSIQDPYKTETLSFVYNNLQVKASYIGIFFQSGNDVNIDNMKQVEGDYNTTPWKKDRVVGSVLKIDNITLNYDF